MVKRITNGWELIQNHLYYILLGTISGLLIKKPGVMIESVNETTEQTPETRTRGIILTLNL